jgi:hypothetical protein
MPKQNRCPKCRTIIPAPRHGWDAHLEERGVYLFPCRTCGADLQAQWDGEDVVVALEHLAPMSTGAELHRQRAEQWN